MANPDSDLIKNMIAARTVPIVAQIQTELKHAYEEGYRDGERAERRFIRARLAGLMIESAGALSLDHVTKLIKLFEDE